MSGLDSLREDALEVLEEGLEDWSKAELHWLLEGGNMREVRDLASGFKQVLRDFVVSDFISVGDTSAEKCISEIDNNSRLQLTSASRYLIESESFTRYQQEQELPLTVASVEELGFTAPHRIGHVLDRIKKIGHLCEAEVGPQFRRYLDDQPHGERVIIAMEPIFGPHNRPHYFSLYQNREFGYLSTVVKNHTDTCSLETKFAFVVDY